MRCSCFCKCDNITEDGICKQCDFGNHEGPTHSHYLRGLLIGVQPEPTTHRHDGGGKFHRHDFDQISYERVADGVVDET